MSLSQLFLFSFSYINTNSYVPPLQIVFQCRSVTYGAILWVAVFVIIFVYEEVRKYFIRRGGKHGTVLETTEFPRLSTNHILNTNRTCVQAHLLLKRFFFFVLISITLSLRLSFTNQTTRRVNLSYYSGATALYIAAKNTSAVQLLAAANADLNQPTHCGITPLRIAAVHGYSTVIEALLTVGADVDLLNHNKQSSLQVAIFHKHTTCAKLLLESGVYVSSADVAFLHQLLGKPRKIQ